MFTGWRATGRRGSRRSGGCPSGRGGALARGVAARPGVGGGVDQGVPSGGGGSGGGNHRYPGDPSAVVAGPAGGVLRAGVVAVSGPELRLRAGHGQVGGGAVSPPPRPAVAGRGP